MSFRMKMVIMTMTLITLLFSVGATILIHTSFEGSLEKEEKSLVETNEMILRVIQFVGEEETWISESKLISVIENLCQQDSVDGLCLLRDESVIYVYQKGQLVSEILPQIENQQENEVYITVLSLETKESFLCTSLEISLNNRNYRLNICSSLTDVYGLREEQMHLFQNIFLVIVALGMFVSWIAATFLTRGLRKLTKATKEIGSGNLSYRSKISSQDEIGELASAFDQMAEKLERNITLLKESAEQKEMFMGAFTHELKTPMTSIIGYADLLRTQKLNKTDTADALDYIFTEGKRLENMSLKMLDLFVADKKEVVLCEASPGALAKYTVKHLRNIYEKEKIRIDVQAEEGICLLEPDLFQTLLINLLDNAKKALEDGGKIVVVIKMCPQGCVISVADEGRGIPQSALKHLTEAFYRVDKARARSKGSAGLGLALCEKIVDLHHGHMEFCSEVGVGTIVTAYLCGGRE